MVEFAEVVAGENVWLEPFHDSESDAEDYLRALDEEQVPDDVFGFSVQVTHEQLDQPFENLQVRVEFPLFEVGPRFRQILLYEISHDFLIDEDPQKIRVIIQGQITFYNLCKSPKGFLFTHAAE